MNTLAFSELERQGLQRFEEQSVSLGERSGEVARIEVPIRNSLTKIKDTTPHTIDLVRTEQGLHADTTAFRRDGSIDLLRRIRLEVDEEDGRLITPYKISWGYEALLGDLSLGMVAETPRVWRHRPDVPESALEVIEAFDVENLPSVHSLIVKFAKNTMAKLRQPDASGEFVDVDVKGRNVTFKRFRVPVSELGEKIHVDSKNRKVVKAVIGVAAVSSLMVTGLLLKHHDGNESK